MKVIKVIESNYDSKFEKMSGCIYSDGINACLEYFDWKGDPTDRPNLYILTAFRNYCKENDLIIKHNKT